MSRAECGYDRGFVTWSDGKGYTVMEDAEVRLQIRWMKEGDWRAKSMPLGQSVCVNLVEGE
jgi:hypothetical protein